MIDWDRVNELRLEVGQDAFDEVVELFLEEVEEETEKLKTLTDRQALPDILHFLKGSALNLGFADFAGLCAAEEKQFSQKGPESVDTVALVDCYFRSKDKFLDRLNDVSHAA